MAIKAASQPLFLRALSHPLHHCLIAAYFPVWLVSNNTNLFDPVDALRPIAIGVGLALLAFLVVRWVTADSHKAAIITSAGIVLFFCFAVVREALPIASQGMAACAILGLIFAGLAYFVWKSRRAGQTATIILNAFALAILLLPAAKIAVSGMGAAAHERAADGERMLTTLPASERPSIVHIVLDGYSRADVLKSLYGFDNSTFIDAIRSAGFTVAERATTPYSQTLMAMNAVFGLDYLNDRLDQLGKSRDMESMRAALSGDLNQSRLLRALRSADYAIVNVESLYKGVALTNADRVISSDGGGLGVSFFEATLLHYTPVERLAIKLGFEDDRYSKTKFALGAHDLGNLPRPFFLYNHILAPHPPFNMTRDGRHQPNFTSMGDGSNRQKVSADWYETYRAGYVEKLHFTNDAILRKIRRIMAEVPDPKIVVIHSDHGGGLYLHREDHRQTCLKERLSAFLAVYASDPDVSRAIAQDTNLTNLYRTIFREAFGLSLASLPKRSYFAPWSAPWQLSRVTEDEISAFGPFCSPSAVSSSQRTSNSSDQLSQVRLFTLPSTPSN